MRETLIHIIPTPPGHPDEIALRAHIARGEKRRRRSIWFWRAGFVACVVAAAILEQYL